MDKVRKLGNPESKIIILKKNFPDLKEMLEQLQALFLIIKIIHPEHYNLVTLSQDALLELRFHTKCRDIERQRRSWYV
jgi:hypothetical protein